MVVRRPRDAWRVDSPECPVPAELSSRRSGSLHNLRDEWMSRQHARVTTPTGIVMHRALALYNSFILISIRRRPPIPLTAGATNCRSVGTIDKKFVWRCFLVERVVLRNDPAGVFLFFRDREQILVRRVLCGTGVALPLIVQDDEWRGIFPLHQIPGNQRVLPFGIAEKVGPLLPVVFFPVGEHLAAIAVAHFCDEGVGRALDGAVAQRIHRDADGYLGQRVAFLGTRQNRRLIPEPVKIAEKDRYEQARKAHGDTEMGFGKRHWIKVWGKGNAVARLRWAHWGAKRSMRYVPANRRDGMRGVQ